jgi:putative endonuclease
LGPGRRRTLGAIAEEVACRFLIEHGLRPVARNYRCRGGEIDLIMQDRQCLAFIEVRCRASGAFVTPSHTVDTRKQRKIIRTAAMFLSRERRFANVRVRFDVIAIEGRSAEGIRWIRDAFRPDDSAL